MFYFLSGRVAVIEPGLAVIDCDGVGYCLRVSLYTSAGLKAGEKAKLYTHLHVREDIFELYGFRDIAEKNCFKLLIDVSGVGPKAAMNILSATLPEQFALGIVNGDEKVLTAASGVGKKLAQRIILELKDKLSKEMPSITSTGVDFQAFTPVTGTPRAEAVNALMVLGYSRRIAETAVEGVEPETEKLEEIIRLALKSIGD